MNASESLNLLLQSPRCRAWRSLSKFALCQYVRLGIARRWLAAFALLSSTAGELYLQVLVAVVLSHMEATIKHFFVGSHQVRSRTMQNVLVAIGSLALCLTGCAGTLNNQWATDSDTLANWKASMQDMPVEVHGNFAGDDAAAAARRIHHGTTPALYREQDFSGRELSSMPRIVLYAGVDQIPTDDTYCSKTPEIHRVALTQSDVDIVAALCDGARIVVQARQEVPRDRLSRDGEAAAVDGIKRRLMLALSTNPSAPPVYN